MSERRATSELREHEQGKLVPAMGAGEYAAFRADVGERGITEPLEITRAGVVLDGRHRLRAAAELGLQSVPVRLAAPSDEVAHMLLAALQRRHLSQSQKATLALELEHYQQARAEAAERRQANLRASKVATLPPRGERTRDLAARLAGVSARTVQDALTVKEADPEMFERIKAGELPAHTARRQLERSRRDAALGPTPPFPGGRYELLYADPPWQLGSPATEYAPESYYPTLSLEEIKALAVPAAERAVLFLWTVNALLPEALEVIEAWGFEYKTNFVWVKDWIGLGVWGRYRHELLLVGRKGDFPPPPGPDRIDSVIEAKRGRHSQKPACVYELLERMYPQASKLELFARGRPRAGWSAWGNEVEAA
jgi:N6-adenosine-specific RNA methylase IME4